MQDGIVISLLSNEEAEPKTIISSLKPSLRMKVRLLCVNKTDGFTYLHY